MYYICYYQEIARFLVLALNSRISLFFFVIFSSYIFPSNCVDNMLLPMSFYKSVNVNSKVFYGDDSHVDYFNSIFIHGSYMLVGARNTIYNISLKTFQETNKITWTPKADDVEKCLRRQQNQDDCQNYIRVIARKEGGDVIVCGTNAYRPLCRTYQLVSKGSKASVLDEDSGIGRSPFSVSQNSTSLFINERLYTATVGDSSGREALIYSKPLRTEQYDSQLLNEPQFVKSFAHLDHAYFLFRETAVENINCGKAIFSRVGRVCLDDPGGDRVLRNSWTTFSKVRLNCSLPGEYPFHFDEIQTSSELGEGSVFSTILSRERTPMIYAVFNTPKNSMGGSAVCAVQMSDIVKSFEGPFKEQKSPQSNWLPVKDPPQPHPASACPSRAHFFSDQTLNFIKSHPLMDRPVPSTPNRPIIVLPKFSYSITSIAVDWQVLGADHRHYDVLFIATDEGSVIKTYNVGRDKKIEMVTVEVLNVFHKQSQETGSKNDQNEEIEHHNLLIKRHKNYIMNINGNDENHGDGLESEKIDIVDDVYTNEKGNVDLNVSSSSDYSQTIREMHIYGRPRSKHKKLLVISQGEMRSIALQRCQYRLTCSECVALRDPYCSWANEKCAATNSGLQNLETGLHPLCKVTKSETQIPPLTSSTAPILSTNETNCPVAEPCNCQVEEIIVKNNVISNEANQIPASSVAQSESHLHLDANDLPKSHQVFECKDGRDSVTENYYVISLFIFLLLVAFGLGLGIGHFYSRNNCNKKDVLATTVTNCSVAVEDNVYKVFPRKPLISTVIADENKDGDNCKYNISQNSTLETLPPKYECTVMIVR